MFLQNSLSMELINMKAFCIQMTVTVALWGRLTLRCHP